jgi:phosphoesterase RecJ-like protein
MTKAATKANKGVQTDNQKVFELFKTCKKFAIVGHINPDGDCIGSALALKTVLNSLGKAGDIYLDERVLPRQFSYLNGYDTIRNGTPDTFDLLVIVDMNSADRMGKYEELLNFASKIVCFDHHLNFSINTANVVISDSTYASCGEIIFRFLRAIDFQITQSIADALYTSVSTDTGCFLYPSTTAETHAIAAELMRAGANIERINYYNFRSYDRRMLFGMKQVIKNMRLFSGGRVAVSAITKIRTKGYTFDTEERHRFKQLVSDAAGVLASAFLVKEGGIWRVSLRSHGDISVEPVAVRFGGGGHKHAAGFSIKGRYKPLVKQITTELGNITKGK